MSTRRGFLKTGVTASLGIGTALSLSGCSQIPIIGSDGGASFTKWLHEPGEFRDVDHYNVTLIRPTRVLSNEDLFSEDQIDRAEDAYDDRLAPTDLDTDQLDRLVFTNVGTILTGSYDENDVIEELEDNDFDDESEGNGYTVYATRDEERAYAVGSDAIVNGRYLSEGETALDVTEELLDVRNGDEDRYTEESDAMDRLIGELDDGFQLWARTFEETDTDDPEAGEFVASVATGWSQSLSSTTSTFKYVVVYDDERDVDVDDLEDWYETAAADDETLAELDDVEYSTSGRAAILEGKVDPDDFTVLF